MSGSKQRANVWSVKALRCGPLRSVDGEAPGPAAESLQGKNPRPEAVLWGFRRAAWSAGSCEAWIGGAMRRP